MRIVLLKAGSVIYVSLLKDASSSRGTSQSLLLLVRLEPITEKLLLNHAKTPGFLAPGGEEFNPGQRRGLIAQSFCVIKFY